MNHALTTLSIWAKIFAFYSANSERTYHKPTICYILILLSTYALVLYFRFSDTLERDIEDINNVAIILQLVTHIFTFCVNIFSNLWTSRRLFAIFRSLNMFDEELARLGHHLPSKSIVRQFYSSLLCAVCFVLYMLLYDLVVDVVIGQSLVEYWLTLIIPILLNYFTAYFMSVTLYYVSLRYSLLGFLLTRLCTPQSIPEFALLKKHFLDGFHQLNTISNTLVPLFSLRICALFSVVFTAGTSNLYLVIQGQFPLNQTMLIINLFLIYLVTITVVIYGHHVLTSKFDSIIQATELLTVNTIYINENELLETYLLVQKSKLRFYIFGVFKITPSIFLTMCTWMVSYLVIMIQFATDCKSGKSGSGGNYHVRQAVKPLEIAI